MSLVIATALMVSAIIGIIVVFATVRTQVDPILFTSKIQKLVLSNHVDKAIKLCNSKPHAMFPNAVKPLLIRANRPHELHLFFEEGLFHIEKMGRISRGTWVHRLVGLIGTLSLTVSVYVLGTDYDSTLIGIFLGVYVLLTSVLYALFILVDTHIVESKLCLVKIRNQLYARSNIVPASHTPRPESALSAEQLAAWKASLEALNEEYHRTRKVDPGKSPQTEYDKQAQPDGVLPPL
jgi:hypothetical protein